jgi:hypothetical protein
MKVLFFLTMCLLIGNGLIAQDSKSTKESRKEASQKKKEEKAAKIEDAYKLMDTILTGRKFVLEAHQLRNKQGAQINVTPNLNFVSVDSMRAVIQIGSNERAGYNGIGGITVDGKVSNWKFSKNDKGKNFDIFMTIQSSIQGIFDVNMTVDYSGYADASITGMRSGRLTFSGVIVPREDSSIFKGQSH